MEAKILTPLSACTCDIATAFRFLVLQRNGSVNIVAFFSLLSDSLDWQ